MLLYGCFNVDISEPLTQYLKTFPTFSREAELQPQRASRTLSFPQTRCFGVCSFNARRRREAGHGQKLCAYIRYYESQTTATSLVLPRPHQSEVD